MFYLSGLNLAYTPGLVEWCPGNDTRVVVVLTYDLHPFLCKFFYCIIGILVSSCHLTPYQHSFYITPVQESFIFDLLMFAKSIITKRMNLIDIFNQRFLTRRCQVRIFPITLIQDQSLVQWVTV